MGDFKLETGGFFPRGIWSYGGFGPTGDLVLGDYIRWDFILGDLVLDPREIYRALIVPNLPEWQSLNPRNFMKNDHR